VQGLLRHPPETEGRPTCVHFSHENCWEVRRRRFKRQACRREFSVNSVKGKSALQLSRELGVQYKTAWVLLMKMREAVASRRFRMMLEGEIHIDGKYAGGHIKQTNRKEDWIDRRRAEYQNFKRLTIPALREKSPFGRGHPPRSYAPERLQVWWQLLANCGKLLSNTEACHSRRRRALAGSCDEHRDEGRDVEVSWQGGKIRSRETSRRSRSRRALILQEPRLRLHRLGGVGMRGCRVGFQNGCRYDPSQLVNKGARPLAIEILRCLCKAQALVEDNMVGPGECPAFDISIDHSQSPPNHSASKTVANHSTPHTCGERRITVAFL
jgi:hypothetical protein